MKDTLTLFSLVVCCFLLIILQEHIPAFGSFGNSRIQLVPMLFCFGALLLSFPVMLLWAMVAGLLLDLSQLQFVGSTPEISFGVGAMYFLLLGAACHGTRPLFLKGSWWILSILSFTGTAFFLFLQYILLSLRRFESGGLFWSEDVLWRILFPAAIAMLIAPLLPTFYSLLGGRLRSLHREPAYE